MDSLGTILKTKVKSSKKSRTHIMITEETGSTIDTLKTANTATSKTSNTRYQKNLMIKSQIQSPGTKSQALKRKIPENPTSQTHFKNYPKEK
jgi:hypothetical protein